MILGRTEMKGTTSLPMTVAEAGVVGGVSGSNLGQTLVELRGLNHVG